MLAVTCSVDTSIASAKLPAAAGNVLSDIWFLCMCCSFAPVTPGRTTAREDYLSLIAEKEARCRICTQDTLLKGLHIVEDIASMLNSCL